MTNKVSPGQPLTIHANDWNVLLDVADKARENILPRPTDTRGLHPSNIIVPVKNNTGSTVDRFHSVGIGTPLFTPTVSANTFKNQFGFDGEVMSSSYFGLPAVYQETVADGRIGMAVIYGLTVAEITVTHADNDRVAVDTAGGSKIVSQFYGAGRIVYKESLTGTKWAIIRIGEFVAPPMMAVADANITAGASGSVTIKINGVSSQQVTAHLTWMEGATDVAIGNELMIRFFKDQNKWIIVGAEC